MEMVQRYVRLRNDLVAASHGLKTLAEQRVVKSCAAKLDSVRLDQGRYRITLTKLDQTDHNAFAIAASLTTRSSDGTSRLTSSMRAVITEIG